MNKFQSKDNVPSYVSNSSKFKSTNDIVDGPRKTSGKKKAKGQRMKLETNQEIKQAFDRY